MIENDTSSQGSDQPCIRIEMVSGNDANDNETKLVNEHQSIPYWITAFMSERNRYIELEMETIDLRNQMKILNENEHENISYCYLFKAERRRYIELQKANDDLRNQLNNVSENKISSVGILNPVSVTQPFQDQVSVVVNQPNDASIEDATKNILMLGNCNETSVLEAMKILSLDMHYSKEDNKDAIKARKRFIDQGGFSLTLAAMRRFIQEDKIQAWGCLILQSSLAYINTERRSKGIEVGSLEMIIAVMKNFSNRAHVMENAFGALYEQTYGVSLQTPPKLVALLLESLETVVPLLKKHLENDKVMYWASRCLREWTNVTKIKTALSEADVKEIYSDIVRVHYFSWRVHSDALCVYNALTG